MASRADIEAGAAFIRLYMKSAEFISDIKQASSYLVTFGQKLIALRSVISSLGLPQLASAMNKVADAAQRVGKSLVGIGVAAGTGLAVPIKQFADFDDAMREVRAVSTLTQAEFAKLTDLARQLGMTTSFSALQVAQLMAELGRAGFTGSQVEKMTGAVLDLSRATSTDATNAAGIMAASLRQFGMEADEAVRVADALTVAANKSFSSVEGLGEALSYAGPVAKDFGMSIENALAIIGGLGNVGIQGSEAGTALRRLLTITGAEAKKLQEIFGVAFVDAAGNARPLVDTLAEVTDATANLGTAARSAKFNEAFGLLGITAASAIGRTRVDIRQLQADLNAAAGTARKSAEDMEAGIGGALHRLTSAIKEIGLAIGAGLADEINALATKLKSAANSISTFVTENKALVVTLFRGAVAAAAIGFSLIAGGIVAKKVAGVFSVLGTVMGTVVPIVSAIGLLFKGVSLALGFFGLSITGVIASAISAVGSLVSFGGVLSLIGSVASIILPPLAMAAAIVAGVAAACAAATAVAGAAAITFWKLAEPFKQLSPVVTAAMSSLGEIAGALLKGDFQGAANLAIEGVKQVFLRGTNAILQMMTNLLNRLPGFVDAALSGAGGIISSVVATMQRAFQTLWPAVKLSFTAFVSFAKDVLDQLPTIAGYVVGRMLRAFYDGWTKLQEFIGKAILNLLESFSGFGPDLIKAMFTGDITGEISKRLQAAFAKTAVTGAALGLVGVGAGVTKAGMPDFAPSAKTVAAWNQVRDAVSETGQMLSSHSDSSGRGTLAAMEDVIKAAWRKIHAAIENATQTQGATGPEAPKWLDPTPIQKYREQLKELLASNPSVEQLAAGLAQIKRETLGIDPTPLQQYQERLLMLTEALKDKTISKADFFAEIAVAQRDILGVDPTPVQQLAERIRELNLQFMSGAFGTGAAGLAEFNRRAMEARTSILGLDVAPIDAFINRVEELRSLPLTMKEFADEFKKAQAAFLGFDPTPIDTMTSRIASLQAALSRGMISREQFNKGALGALPDNLQETIEKSKPAKEKQRELVQKFEQDLAMLRQQRDLGTITPEHFDSARQGLEKDLFSDVAATMQKSAGEITSSGTFSAAGAKGLGIGGFNVDKNEKAFGNALEKSEVLRVIAANTGKGRTFRR